MNKESLRAYVLSRMNEKSTWVGFIAMGAGLIGLPLSSDEVAWMASIGVFIGGCLAAAIPESKG